jgi:hypothetical protein
MVVVGNQPREVFRMGNWGSMISSWKTKLWKESSLKRLRKKKNLRAILMRRTLREMASRITSRKKRRQEPRSPLALLAWGHSALISRKGSSSWRSSWRFW